MSGSIRRFDPAELVARGGADFFANRKPLFQASPAVAGARDYR